MTTSRSKFARIFEITGGDTPETVFELVMDAGEFPGWSIYPADRIERLQ